MVPVSDTMKQKMAIMRPRVLITGSHGFIGTWLKHELGSFGDCVGVDLVTDSSDGRGAEEVQCDVRDFEAMARVFGNVRPTHVVHLAAIASAAACDREKSVARETNVGGTANVVRLCRQFPEVRRLVFVSSSMVLGHFRSRSVSEEHATAPVNYYGELKLESERLVEECFRDGDGTDYAILRLMAVYGPGDAKRRVVSAVLHRLLRDERAEVCGCENRIGFTYISDVGRAIGAALRIGGPVNRVVHVGQCQSWTLMEMAQMVRTEVGRGEVTRRSARCECVRRGAFNGARARELLNWMPEVDLASGIRRLVAEEVLVHG